MLVRFGDYIERFRFHLENTVESFQNTSKNDEEFEEKVLKYFEKMKKNNYDLYAQTLGLLLSDHYKLLYEKEKIGKIREEDKDILKLYDELYGNDEVVDYIESDSDMLIGLIFQMNEYNSLDYFTKRKILICCEDVFDKLKQFSMLNVLDYLYYCQKYNVEVFKYLFNYDIDNGWGKKEAITKLLCTLEELNTSDRKNYLELISDLLVEYYKLGKYEMNFKKTSYKS